MPDPDPRDEPTAEAALAAAGARIVTGVALHAAPWLGRRCDLVVDAWNRVRPPDRPVAERALAIAVETAVRRVVEELERLFAEDPARQRSTPLAVLRSLGREPTAVLATAGVPAVVRDAFDERAWPEDRYDLMPRALADLDDSLGPELLAWGLAKSKVLRARQSGPL